MPYFKPSPKPAEILAGKDLRDIADPNNLRSPVTVSRYVGIAGGDYGHKQASFDQSDHDGEQEIAQLMHACGYRGGDPQQPDLGSINSASNHLRKTRGF